MSCVPIVPIAPEIATLGPAKLPTPLESGYFSKDADRIPLCIDSSLSQDLAEPQTMLFEPAGPRALLYFDPGKVKCAIVTCGGLCPGLNDVIRAIVMEAHYCYGVAAVLGIRHGLEGFIPSYKHNIMELTPENMGYIHEFGGTILGSSRGPQPPDAIVDALERMNVGVLFLIGGDGSMKAASHIMEEVRRRNLRMSIIGIPKTIDNDINFISQSFGFDTAVDKAAEIIRCAHVEAEGVPYGIGMVKLMGRESGFIAAQATLAMREVNFVLIPEAPFVLDGEGGLLSALDKRLAARGHAVVVVAEGAGQHLLEATGKRDASGNPVLGDIVALLRDAFVSYFKNRNKNATVKIIDPSYMIRSVPANANDRVYCGFLGQYAVHAAMAGKTDMVVAKIMDRYVHLPLGMVITNRRRLDTRSAFWRAVLESTGQGELTGMYPGTADE
jgi:6-phosphofructokinase 1